MDQDLALDAIYWAKELLNVEPEDLDAHYVLAAEALEERAPNVPEIKRHLEVLEKAKAPAVRRLWIRARLAELAGDDSARAAALAEARAIAPGAEPDRGQPVRPAEVDGPGSPVGEPTRSGSPSRSRGSASRSRGWASPRSCRRNGSRGCGRCWSRPSGR